MPAAAPAASGVTAATASALHASSTRTIVSNADLPGARWRRRCSGTSSGLIGSSPARLTRCAARLGVLLDGRGTPCRHLGDAWLKHRNRTMICRVQHPLRPLSADVRGSITNEAMVSARAGAAAAACRTGKTVGSVTKIGSVPLARRTTRFTPRLAEAASKRRVGVAAKQVIGARIVLRQFMPFV